MASWYPLNRFFEISNVVVHDHAVGVDAGADAVVEDERHARVEQLLEVSILAGVLGLRHDDAADTVLQERLTDAAFALVALIALRHHDAVTADDGLLLDAGENGREVVVRNLRDDDADDLLRCYAAVAQALCQHVGIEVVLACILLDSLALFLADAWTVLQRPADSSDADTQFARDVFHRDVLLSVHVIHVCVAKVSKI